MNTEKAFTPGIKADKAERNATYCDADKKLLADANGVRKQVQKKKTAISSGWLDVLLSKYLSSYLLFFSMSGMFS